MRSFYFLFLLSITLAQYSCKDAPTVQNDNKSDSKDFITEKEDNLNPEKVKLEVKNLQTGNITPNDKKESSNTADPIEKKQKPASIKPTNKDLATIAKPAEKKPLPGPEISFESRVFDFGEIDEGDQIKHIFKFTNTGKGPLNIEDVSASCGCTVPSYPIMPIGPGETGEIGVLYNSKGKFGSQKPFLTIKSNATEPLVKLYLNGSIKHVFEKPPTDTTKTAGKDFNSSK